MPNIVLAKTQKFLLRTFAIVSLLKLVCFYYLCLVLFCLYCCHFCYLNKKIITVNITVISHCFYLFPKIKIKKIRVDL